MTGDVVLSSLQLLDDWNRSAIQQRVAAVDSWWDDAAGNGLCHFSSQIDVYARVAGHECGSCTPWRQLWHGCQSTCGCQWSRRGTSAEMRLVSSSSSSTTFLT